MLAGSLMGLDRQRDTLAAADAERHDTAPQAVTTHGMNQSGCEDRAGRADRMAMRDRTAVDVDDVLGQAEFAHDSDDDCGERLVDLDPLDITELPARSVKRLTDGRNRSEAKHPRLDGRD